jgi:hypothetical protein
VKRTCSWCQALNACPVGVAVFCSECGHRADLPRMLCDCLRCRRPRASIPLYTLRQLRRLSSN